MSVDNKICLALDTSYEQGAVVLFCGDDILFAETLGQKFSHGKLLGEAIDASLRIMLPTHVLCGLGPGSFVGVRIALATALGFCLARSLPLMGFCSHEALALSTGLATDFSVFMKASGDLGYFTRYRADDEAYREAASTKVISVEELRDTLIEGTIICSDLVERMHNIFSSSYHLRKICGPTPHGLVLAAQARMRRMSGFIDESTTIKPNYVKAPSVSVPKKSLIIGLSGD